MHVAPAGFTFVPGTDRVTATAIVFDVTREGGGGLVYVCKRLGARAREEQWVRDRLAAEGKLLERLGGRGTPELIAAGEDGGGPWIVMGRVAGRPLSRCMGTSETSWIERAARHAFVALAGLHEAGVLHADLNPDNVIVADDAHAATILDFGLARWPGAPPMPHGPFRGTLAYAAPELVRGEPFDVRADVFALAATLLHVASGEVPRAQETPAAMLLAAGDTGIEPWAARSGKSLSPALAAVLTRCCAFDPAARPATAREVASCY